jgi:dipeptidyl aminopeptidase/acylaminoacyl peptidase
MQFRLALRLLLLLTLALGSLAQAESKRALVPEDSYRVQEVSGLRISPDGQWIAYTVASVDREADKRRTALWMVNWDGTQDIQLTFGTQSASSPRWSPDGKFISFLSKREDDAKTQIWLLDRRGGEARPLTDVKNDIADYEWSPDGKRLLLEMQDLSEADTEAAKNPSAPKTAKPPKPIVIHRYHFKQDVDGYLTSSSQNHLYLFDLESKAVQPLTSGSGVNDGGAKWSPDGGSIAFIRTAELEPDQNPTTTLLIIESQAGAAPRKIAAANSLSNLRWSPDSGTIAFLQGESDDPKLEIYNPRLLAVVSAAGGTPRLLTSKLDRNADSPEFTADGAALRFLVEDDRQQYLAQVRLAGGGVERIGSDAPLVLEQASNGGNTAVIAASDTALPEVFALENKQLRKLTSHNDRWLSELELGAVEDISFRSKDGTEVHGMMVKPPNYEKGKKYPTILWIHGGPNGQDDHALPSALYALQFERQLFAAHGYVALAINYRGGTGRGAAYARAIMADWGNKEVADLLAGVDYAVQKGIADPARLGIGGWSYGGILTDYTIASDPRFKAAMSGAGSANQISMYGSDQYIRQYNGEITPPWRNQELWIKLSYPFFHADRIKTPTLFVGGEKDFNVPIIGGEQMYQSLRTLGVPTELVIYPEQNHIFTRPSYIYDRLQRYFAWYDKYLKP